MRVGWSTGWGRGARLGLAAWLAFAGVARGQPGDTASPDDPPGDEPPAEAPAEPAPPPAPIPDPAPSAESRPFDDVLADAKQRYFQGDSDKARELLEGLRLRLYAGEKPEWSSIVDALTYLGEIYYVLGQQDQAQIAFEYLLEQDPKTPISPYHHSIEVVNLFELVRTSVIASRAEPPPPLVPERSPLPLWTFVPFGAPQVFQRRPVAGAVYGLLQAGFGAASIGLYIQVKGLNPDTDAEGNHHPLWPREEVPAGVDRRRYSLQWPTTFAFYGLWGMSVLDAIVYHGRHPRMVPPTAIDGGVPTSSGGGPKPPMLLFHGRF